MGGRTQLQGNIKMFVLHGLKEKKREKKERHQIPKTNKKTPTHSDDLYVDVETISTPVCNNMIMRKQVCMKTVGSNTWPRIIKQIVKAIRPPHCD